MVSSKEGLVSPSSWLGLYVHTKSLFPKLCSACQGGWIRSGLRSSHICQNSPPFTTACTIVLSLSDPQCWITGQILSPHPYPSVVDSACLPLIFFNSKASWSKLSQFIRKGLIILVSKVKEARSASFALPLGFLTPT